MVFCWSSVLQVHVCFGTSFGLPESGAGRVVPLQNVEPPRHLNVSTCKIRNLCE